MKKFFLLTGVLALFSLTSCKKVWDYVKDHPNGYADNCKVDKIYFTQNYPDPLETDDYILYQDTANFNYDTKGQLISIDYASDANHLNIDVYPIIGFGFAHDSKGRLLGFFEQGRVLGNKIIGTRGHKYTYVNDNMVIDSTFKKYLTAIHSGDDLTMSWYGDFVGVDSIFLDSWGRIVKDGSRTYSYDASGNLIKPGVRYTNKTSIFQTDKTLMFITRDYSVNAPVDMATQFNSNQLPVKLNPGEPALFVTTIDLYRPDFENPGTKVTYQCR